MCALFRKSQYSTIKPKTDTKPKKVSIPKGLAQKCKKCSKMLMDKELNDNLLVCPHCGYHVPMKASQRIELLSDKGSFKEIDSDLESVDILKFEGVTSYKKKIEKNKEKTGMKDSVLCGTCTLDKKAMALAVMDFRFLGASMGSVVGEKITRLTEKATAEKLPLIIVTASGGARMYEGMFSLMQMAKTSGAIYRHKEAGLPYIVIMTHPTTAGVTASFASLGDLTFAEPKALIGFAGPRVIRDTTQAKLPEDFQSSEFLMKKGMIDRIIERKNLAAELSLCLDFFNGNTKVKKN